MNYNLTIDKKIKFNITDALYIFIFSSFIGWCIEVCYIYTITGRIVDRGFCFGPVCTIYGIGTLILYILFGNIHNSTKNIIYVFLTCSVLLGSFELISGLILKYALGIEMWNYNGQFLELFNYTTIPIALNWGFVACVYIFLIQPIFLKVLHTLPKNFAKKLIVILMCVYFIDYFTSMYTIGNDPSVLYKLVNP